MRLVKILLVLTMIIITGLVSCFSVLGFDRNVFYAVKVKNDEPILIDGQKDLIYNQSTKIDFKLVSGNNLLNNDVSAEAFMAWDEQNIYLYFDVKDNKTIDFPGQGEGYKYDSIDITWDLKGNFLGDVNNAIEKSIRVFPNDMQTGEQVEFKSIKNNNGYNVEIKIVNNGIFQENDCLGFGICINNSDGVNINQIGKFGTNDTGGDEYRFKSVWDAIVLVDLPFVYKSVWPKGPYQPPVDQSSSSSTTNSSSLSQTSSTSSTQSINSLTSSSNNLSSKVNSSITKQNNPRTANIILVGPLLFLSVAIIFLLIKLRKKNNNI